MNDEIKTIGHSIRDFKVEISRLEGRKQIGVPELDEIIKELKERVETLEHIKQKLFHLNQLFILMKE